MTNTKNHTEPAGDQRPRSLLALRALDLVALLALLAVAATVFVAAGPSAFGAVASVATALFATWRGHRRSE